MADGTTGFVQAMQSLFGGAATSLFGAIVGRLMYHSTKRKDSRRPFWGWHLLWEPVIGAGGIIIGEGLSGYWGLSPAASLALVAVLSYLGPKGAEHLLDRWLDRGVEK